MKNKNLYRAFLEGVSAAIGAHLGAWALLVTADRLVYFCGHVVVVLVIRLLG
jgi:hypothetical protein